MDRKKVIKGLQCIIDGTVRCESCGYAIDKHGHHSCQQNCASDAIAVLKEQEPVKPIKSKLSFTHGFNWDIWDCGCCGNQLRSFAKYCDQCGKAVKWE